MRALFFVESWLVFRAHPISHAAQHRIHFTNSGRNIEAHLRMLLLNGGKQFRQIFLEMPATRQKHRYQRDAMYAMRRQLVNRVFQCRLHVFEERHHDGCTG